MRLGLRRFGRLSEGERARVLAFILVAVLGVWMGLLMALRVEGGAAIVDGLSWYGRWIIAASVIGAVAALFLSGDRLGQTGPYAGTRVVTGAVWVSMVGAVIAGTLVLPLYGTMFAPFTLVITLATSPVLLAFWCVQFFCIHVLMVIYRRERDSIYDNFMTTSPDAPVHLRRSLLGARAYRPLR